MWVTSIPICLSNLKQLIFTLMLNMRPIRIGLCNLPPYYFVTSPTTVDGIFAPIIREGLERLLAIQDNSTLISIDNCSILSDLSHGKVDYILPIQLSFIYDLGNNLSTTSITSEDACYLAHKRQFELNLRYPSFFDFIYSFDKNFWLLMMIIFGGFLTTLNLLIKVNWKPVNLVNIILLQSRYLLFQDRDKFLSLLSRKFSIILIISLLMLGKLLSSSLQTSLVQNPEAIKVNTLDDIVKYNYQPVAYDIIECRNEFQVGLDHINERDSSRIAIKPIKGSSIIDQYRFLKDDKHVSVVTREWSNVIKNIGCIYDYVYEMTAPFERSDIPVFNSIKGDLISKANEPVVNQLIARRCYSSFEGGISRNHNWDDLLAKCLDVSGAKISCRDLKMKAKVSAIPVTLSYLSVPFFILFAGYFVAILSMFLLR